MKRQGFIRVGMCLGVLALAACGGGGGSDDIATAPGGGQGSPSPVLPIGPIGGGSGGEAPAPATPDADTPSTTRFLLEGADVGELLSAAVLEADRDEDGLADVIDPYPDTPALRDDPAQPLRIQRAGLRLDGGWANGVAHADQPLIIELTGATPGEPLFVVLGRSEGLQVLPVTTLEDGLITLPANMLAVPLAGLSVMTAQWRSEAVPLRWVAADAPWVTGVGDAEQGRLLELEGLNLASAEVMLNDQPLHVVDARADRLSVALPPDAASGTLAITQDHGEPQRLPLMVWRTVRVELAPELADLVTRLEWFDNDDPLLAPTAASFTRRVMATAGAGLVRFRPDLERPALPLTVLMDPQDMRLQLSAEQMLIGLAYRLRKAAEPEVIDDAAAVKAAILSRLASTEGQALLADFRTSLPDYDFTLLRTHQDRLTALLAGHLPTQTVAKFFYEGLSDRTVYDQNIKFRNYNSGTSFTGANLPGIARKEISNFRIALADPQLSVFERCNSLPQPPRPATAWPSDLCVENDNVVPASVGVFVGEGRNRRYLRSHLNPKRFTNEALNLFNADILGGNTLGIFRVAQHQYLETRDENAQPLCRLMPCSVEILTGAFGFADNTPLEGNGAVAGLLFRRMLLDVFVLPFLAEVLGFDADAASPQSRQCFVSLGNDALAAVPLIPDFAAKFRDTRGANNQPDEAKLEAFTDQVLQELFLKLFDVIQSSGSTCALAIVQGTARQRLSNALEDLAERNAVGRILSVIDTTIALIEVAITPRRIVFDVKPVLLEAATLNRRTVSPSDGENLAIEGIGIAQNDDGAGRRYFPALVVTGRALNGSATQTASFTFTADHFAETGTLGLVRLTVPSANLRTLLETNFLPGDLQMKLRYFHRPYPGFPNQQVEIPLGTVNYRGQPVASRLGEAATLPGETIRILGYRLAALNLSSEPVEVVFTPGGLTDEPTVRTRALRVSNDFQAPGDERGFLEVAAPNFQRQGTRVSQTYAVAVDLGQNLQPGQILGEPARLRPVGSIQVYDGQPGRVTVADTGACPTDDEALVELLRLDGQRATFPEAVNIPGSFTVGRQNDYAASLTWLDELTTATNRVEQIRVTCTDAGNDCGRAGEGASVCTFTVRIESPEGADLVYQETLEEGELLFFSVR